MCIHSIAPEFVPEETARIDQLAFPKGNLYLKMRQEFPIVFQDKRFLPLFSSTGHPSTDGSAPATTANSPLRPRVHQC
jgi:hypothetical protein